MGSSSSKPKLRTHFPENDRDFQDSLNSFVNDVCSIGPHNFMGIQELELAYCLHMRETLGYERWNFVHMHCNAKKILNILLSNAGVVWYPNRDIVTGINIKLWPIVRYPPIEACPNGAKLKLVQMEPNFENIERLM
jgi:hypothetical protein